MPDKLMENEEFFEKLRTGLRNISLPPEGKLEIIFLNEKIRVRINKLFSCLSVIIKKYEKISLFYL